MSFDFRKTFGGTKEERRKREDERWERFQKLWKEERNCLVCKHCTSREVGVSPYTDSEITCHKTGKIMPSIKRNCEMWEEKE